MGMSMMLDSTVVRARPWVGGIEKVWGACPPVIPSHKNYKQLCDHNPLAFLLSQQALALAPLAYAGILTRRRCLKRSRRR